MPIRINCLCDSAVRLGFQPLSSAISLHDCSAVLSSQMKKELVRISSIGSMTTHALTRQERAFQYRILIEVMDIPLIDAYLAVSLVTRCELTVCHTIVIERIFAHEDKKRE